MNLLIDLGNSRIKWAFARGTQLRERGGSHFAGRPLTEVLEDVVADAPSPTRVAVASVAARSVTEELIDWVSSHYRLTPDLVRAEARGFGVINAYREASRLGADRWAALVGARRRETGGVCVVDCGTAITIDLLDGRGRHRGGLIGAGVPTMRSALYDATAGIPDEGEGTITPLATDTRSAVTAGTLYAAAAFVDRAHAEFEQQCGERLPCLLTGGDAPTLRSLLRTPHKSAPHLVLEGLAVIVNGQ